jgi:hypothetical protein
MSDRDPYLPLVFDGAIVAGATFGVPQQTVSGQHLLQLRVNDRNGR